MNVIPKIRLINNRKNIINNITSYKNGIEVLEKAFWRISHDDILMSLISLFRSIISKKLVLIISSMNNKNKREILTKYLYRWKYTSMMIKKSISDKEKTIRLKIILLRQENNRIKILSKFFNKWKSKTLINKKNSKEINNNFCYLYSIWYNKIIENSKIDLINNLCVRYIDKQGQKFAKINMRKIFVKYIFQKIRKEAFKPLIIKVNIKKLIISTKEVEQIQKNKYLTTIIRKWRFITFVSNLAKKKLKLMYNKLHVSYLDIADEIFNTPEVMTSKEVKELLKYENLKKSNQINSFFIKELGFNSEESFYKSCEKKNM